MNKMSREAIWDVPKALAQETRDGEVSISIVPKIRSHCGTPKYQVP